jgi:WD40 repeat protein
LEAQVGEGVSEWVAGSRIGNWTLESLLGRGGSGEVFQAQHLSDQSIVVIKVLSAALSLDESARYRFEFEADHRLVHPGIVPVIASGEHFGRPYLVLPYYAGGSLDRWVATVWGSEQESRWARMPHPRSDDFFRRIALMAAEIARAVAFAHEHGLIHRDLKPSNILLDVEGTPSVADFGSSRRLNVSERISNTGVVCGSPEYLPPEIASGKATGGTTASDIYGLGAILFEVLSGTPPYSGPNVMATLQQIAAGPDPVLRGRNPRVPRELALIVQTCLARDPSARYRAALDVAEDLECFSRDEPLSVLPRTALQQLLQWAGRNRLAAGLAMACVIILGVTSVTASLEWKRASQAAEDQRRQVVGQWIGQGIEAVRAGHALSGLPWLAAAWRSDARSGVVADRLRLHQQRFREAARNLPKLDQVRSLPFPVRSLATSPSGRWVAAAGFAAHQGIAVWSSEVQGQSVLQVPLEWPVAQLSFSSGGDLLFAHCLDDHQVFHLVLFDLKSAKVRFAITLPDRANSVETSPEGDRIAVGCRDGSLSILEAEHGTALEVFRHPGQVRRVAWLSSSRLASVGWDNWVRVWDLGEHRQVAGWDTGEYLRDLVVSLSGRWMVFSGDNRLATLVDLESLQTRAQLPHSGWVMATAASTNGKVLATGDRLGNVRLWDTASGRPLIDWLNTGGVEVRRLAFSPDGQMLGGLCIDKTFRCWAVSDGRMLGSILPMEIEPYALNWLSSNRVVTITAAGASQVWSMEALISERGPSALPGGIQKAATSESGAWVALHLGDKGVLVEHLSPSGQERRMLTSRRDVTELAFQPGTSRLAVADLSPVVKLWDLEGSPSQPLQWPLSAAPSSIGFNPAGDLMASVTTEGHLSVRRSAPDERESRMGEFSGDSEFEQRLPVTGPIATQMRWSPDGRRLLIGTAPQYRQVSRSDRRPCFFSYDVPSRKVSSLGSLGFNEVLALQISGDGQWAAASGLNGGVRLIRLNSGDIPTLGPLLSHPMVITSLQFDRNPRRVFTGGYDQTIRVWDIATGRLLRSDLRLTGSIRNIVLNRQGTMMLMGSESGTVGLWDPETLEPICVGAALTRSIRFCDLSADSRSAIYGGADRRLYRMPLEVPGLELAEAELTVKALAPFVVDELGRRMDLSVEDSHAAWTQWRAAQERHPSRRESKGR